MTPEQQDQLEDVIAKIKQMLPLTYEEELIYLMGIRKMSKEEGLSFIRTVVDEEGYGK